MTIFDVDKESEKVLATDKVYATPGGVLVVGPL
jgi:hypothetical protein